MLILASTSDKLRVLTTAAGAIDVHASWMDNVAGAVNPGRTNTPSITTAGTTDVVGSPVSGVFRNIKTLHVHNRGAGTNTVAVLHTDGTTVVELHRAILLPGETLQYIDEVGFIPPAAQSRALAWTATIVTATNAAWPVPLGTVEMELELWGGGGSGAGRFSDGSGGIARGTGGGGGGYVLKRYAGIMDATLNITIGAGGAASGDGGAGHAGGASSIVGTNLGTLTAGGGGGGGAGFNSGGGGGTASGGDLNLGGGDGTANTGPVGQSYGIGGGSPRGGRGGATNVGESGSIPGGGGSGQNHDGSGPSGAGARGQALIWTRR